MALYGPAMPRRRGIDRQPRAYVVDGDWPDGTLDVAAPAAVVATAQLVRRIRAAMGTRSARDVAVAADLQHTTLLALLRGERIPDISTVLKLERALDADLWPGGREG